MSDQAFVTSGQKATEFLANKTKTSTDALERVVRETPKFIEFNGSLYQKIVDGLQHVKDINE